MSLNLTVIVLTYNEELNIEECIRSLSPFDSRIVVVDSGSKDKTLDILKKYKVEVFKVYKDFSIFKIAQGNLNFKIPSHQPR